MGWEHFDGFPEFSYPAGSALGRETKGEVVLIERLRPVLERLNPDLPPEAIHQAMDEIIRDRSVMSLVEANRQIYRILKDGVRVSLPSTERDSEIVHLVRILDWNNAENNDFLLVSQFWVTGEMYTRRADLVGFVNGIPLLFVELKAVHKALENAYGKNLKDYKETIPHLLWYNQLVILSNGSKSLLGSVTAAWEHFADWKKVGSEKEKGIVSLETMLRGTCEPSRFLDLVENFLLFKETRGGLIKIAAKNHQYLGVNNTIDALMRIKQGKGKLGVFWHTQGSGKSVSMIFFSQKVLRKIPGNWSFVVVTDRKELDRQIYKEFANTGAITEPEVQATSSSHLRQLLGEDHRYIFTLIHKFRTDSGGRHPELSDRSDIIVITDEAHRTQYDILAMNMRDALPKAAFIAFTGTPLIVSEEKTRQVFGDYVSIYNFKQSVDDHATVPLHYVNRIPELQLTNDDLNEKIYQVIEEAELDELQEVKLERHLGRQYHLITREDRLDIISQDIVAHFMGRGFRGKAMVVSIDKATAIKMYDRVQKHWKSRKAILRKKMEEVPKERRGRIQEDLKYMQETDMAVVVSQAQNEIEDMRKKGVDIARHRERVVKEDLETKFKDPHDPFRIVFVCAMWMTGFDVPCCSTIYLDKPLKNHSLMQTIARANRVFEDKVDGLIVDYIGIFRPLQKALAVYGSGSGGGVDPGDEPITNKSVLVDDLKEALAGAIAFCKRHGVDLEALKTAPGLEKVRQIDIAVDAILVNEDSKKDYLTLARDVRKLYKAILPDPAASSLLPDCLALQVIAAKILSLSPEVDISGVMAEIERILDESIGAQGYVIREPGAGEDVSGYVDLSKIDFEALARKFKVGKKRIEAEKLKNAIRRKIEIMVRMNRMRIDFLERFQRMIDEYNSGSVNIEGFFDSLRKLAEDLTKEERRGVTEKLSEEELAVFDILTKPEIKITQPDRKKVKRVARQLLETLKQEKLVLDWRKRQESRAAVRLAIEEMLDNLPAVYTKDIYRSKCGAVYQHVYESYRDVEANIYSGVG